MIYSASVPKWDILRAARVQRILRPTGPHAVTRHPSRRPDRRVGRPDPPLIRPPLPVGGFAGPDATTVAAESRLEPKQKLRATNGGDADFPDIAAWSMVARV